MGANSFQNVGVAKTAGEAFDRLAENDRYENGHSYSGGIGMKGGFVTFALPKGVKASEFHTAATQVFRPAYYGEGDGTERFTSRRAEHVAWRKTHWGAEATRIYKKWSKDPSLVALAKRAHGVYDDKWGAAVAVEVTGAEAKQYLDNAEAYGLVRRYVKKDGQLVVAGRPRGLKVWMFFGMASS